MFFIPQKEQHEDIVKMIEENGGAIVNQFECQAFQLKPESIKITFSDFFKGPIYSSNWIEECLQQGELINPMEDHLICINVDKRSRKMEFDTEGPFTILEGIKMFDIVRENDDVSNFGRQFWEKQVASSLIPGRSGEQMHNLWKELSELSIEQYLMNSL